MNITESLEMRKYNELVDLINSLTEIGSRYELMIKDLKERTDG